MPLKTRPALAALVYPMIAVTTLGACAHRLAPPENGATSATVAQRYSDPELQRLVPLVDHHQHLLSPAGAALENIPPAPPVSVSTSIAQLLENRARLTSEASELAKLYTRDATLLSWAPPQWIRSPEKISEFIGMYFRPGYRLTPVSYTVRGTAAEVAGYYSRGSGDTLRHVGQFTMFLTRATNGEWRIASETPVFPGPVVEEPFEAAELVEMLDAAGIRRAVVLSDAYYFDGLIKHEADPYKAMRAENDWTAEQVARFPDRLIAFCSFNPLADYAIDELRRCASMPQFKGLKLHFGTSGVDILNPEHAAKVQRVAAEANSLGWPVMAHLTASMDYGEPHAEAFLNTVLPAAPDVPIVIAHLWGGAGYSDDALAVFARAVRGNPLARNLYFDLAQMTLRQSDDNLEKMAVRMREIGLDRMFYGSDGPRMGGLPPRQMWADFRVKLPLTDEEVRQIARNVAPYAQ